MSWSIEELTKLTTAYWDSCAVLAAVELGLFDAIEGKGATAAEAAGRIGASARHTAELLDALTALELLEKHRGTAGTEGDYVYALRPSAAQFLTRSGSYCILDALRFNIDLYPVWGKLAECVRTGKPAIPPGAHLGADKERTRRFVMGMHSRALAMTPALVPALDMAGRARLLDVASGPGAFSAALAEKYLQLNVVLFDLPPVLEVAGELLAKRPSAPRISFHPGDYRRDTLPRGFDAVLYCGALHQENPESAAALFGQFHDSLEPGGRLFVVDMMLQKDRAAPRFSILFSINMMLTSPRGRAFTEDDTKDLLAKAGFAHPVSAHLRDCPYWVITADKPPAGRLHR